MITPCAYNYGGIGIWGGLYIWLPVITPSLLGMASWGLQYVCLSDGTSITIDWVAYREHLFLTVLESGKSRTVAPANVVFSKAFLVC